MVDEGGSARSSNVVGREQKAESVLLGLEQQQRKFAHFETRGKGGPAEGVAKETSGQRRLSKVATRSHHDAFILYHKLEL